VTRKPLAYADDLKLLGDNINTIKKHTETLIDASNEVGLEVNTEKTKYMLLFHHQNAEQTHDLKIADLMKVYHGSNTFVNNNNKSVIQEEIKRRLNLGNTCYQSVKNLLFSLLLSKDMKIKIYKAVILLVVVYGCETWFLTLREEHRLGVFENRLLRRICGLKGDEVMGCRRKLHNEELRNLYSSPNIIRMIK
jgi:hypothetical protein